MCVKINKEMIREMLENQQFSMPEEMEDYHVVLHIHGHWEVVMNDDGSRWVVERDYYKREWVLVPLNWGYAGRADWPPPSRPVHNLMDAARAVDRQKQRKDK